MNISVPVRKAVVRQLALSTPIIYPFYSATHHAINESWHFVPACTTV